MHDVPDLVGKHHTFSSKRGCTWWLWLDAQLTENDDLETKGECQASAEDCNAAQRISNQVS